MTVASQVKQTLVSLKGARAGLRLYSAQVQNEEAEAVFKEAVETTEEVIYDLEERLKTLEFEEPQYKGV